MKLLDTVWICILSTVMGPSGHVGYIYIYIYIAYIGLFGTGKCRFFKWVELPVQRDSARFSEVASGNPTSTCIPRVDG